MTFSEVLTASGKKMTEIADEFAIPYRTLQEWKSARRTPPEYVLRLLAAALGVSK